MLILSYTYPRYLSPGALITPHMDPLSSPRTLSSSKTFAAFNTLIKSNDYSYTELFSRILSIFWNSHDPLSFIHYPITRMLSTSWPLLLLFLFPIVLCSSVKETAPSSR